MKGLRINIIAAFVTTSGLVLSLDHDRPDFWIKLGPVGWGRFQNSRRTYPPNPGEDLTVSVSVSKKTLALMNTTNQKVKSTEERFVLVEVLPEGSLAPSPLISWSNVLWQQKEALLALLRQMSFLDGLEGN